jgi:hypothetical protein
MAGEALHSKVTELPSARRLGQFISRFTKAVLSEACVRQRRIALFLCLPDSGASDDSNVESICTHSAGRRLMEASHTVIHLHFGYILLLRRMAAKL